MMKRSRGYFREQRSRHIAHRKRYAKYYYSEPYFQYDGQYGDTKPFCSCPMCSEKTNNKGKHGNRWMKSKDWKHSDQQKIERMDYQENELETKE